MYKNDRVIRRYFESFKLKIISELSTGKYTKYELGNLYGLLPPPLMNGLENKNAKI